MSKMEQPKFRRGESMLVAVGLVAVLLVGCTRAETVEVTVSGLPPSPVAAPVSSEPTSSFQGAITEIDLARSELSMAVHIVWTPVLKAEQEDRRVAVSETTRWKPTGAGLTVLRTGEEVQVDAVLGADGTWEARQVHLFDID